jgi:Ca-activated chloride channel family protein
MRDSQSSRPRLQLLSLLVVTLLTAPLASGAQLVLSRDSHPSGTYTGVVDVVVVPGFDSATVTISVDGQKLVESLHSPWHVPVDFGPTAVEHKVVVTAVTTDQKRVQWQTTINKGHLSLSIKLRPIDVGSRVFEAEVSTPDDDPVTAVSVWEGGKAIITATAEPYRFTIPAEHFAQRFVQATVRTRSGAEAADFWSGSGEVQAADLQVRTVPLFVSVVDRDGNTRDDVDQSLFRIIDNGAEGKILEVGKAFNQPISIALLLDASASMTYEMENANRAALAFVQRTLKDGDRCTVFSIRETPRREIALTTDRAAVAKAVAGMRAMGRTSLYDAISSAVRELRDEKNRRAIVVLTDGGDTSSIMSFDEIDRLTKESGIPLYFIAYQSGEPTAPQELDRLTYLAGETGGFVATASAQNLQAKYGDIEKDLRAQYAIVYQISDFAKRNQWRKVRVMVNSKTLQARTIRGYFAP